MERKMIKDVLVQAMEEGRKEIPYGKTAAYIPELGHIDKNNLGVCIYTKDGERYCAGDTKTRFTLQSVSKVISLAVALEKFGFHCVFRKVGMEPSGDAFNSLARLDVYSDVPFNPMINSGAIAIASYLAAQVTFEEMMEMTRKLCQDEEIVLDEAVYHSEMEHIARNRAIAYLLESKGILGCDVDSSLEMYVKMCSLNATAESLASFGMVLANGGKHPETGERLLCKDVVRIVKAIMLTCGMYDGSGEFAVHVGVPSKSGVGGGILSTVKGRMGIGIYGPALDDKGNSIAGKKILECLSKELKLHMFEAD